MGAESAAQRRVVLHMESGPLTCLLNELLNLEYS
jgi:hypothetical protein